MSIKISQESDNTAPVAMTISDIAKFIERAKALGIYNTATPTVMIDGCVKHIWKITVEQ